MAPFQSQNSPGKWSEIIDNLWEHLSHFKGKQELLLYDSNFTSKSSQFVDEEGSTNNDDVTWPHQITCSIMEGSLEETDEISKKKSEWLFSDHELRS